jgi:hypothetical protein
MLLGGTAIGPIAQRPGTVDARPPRMQLRTRRRYSLVATQETERTLSLVLATSLRVAIAAT